MSDQRQSFLVPVLSRPAQLPFVVEPADKSQPSLTARCGHTVWRVEHLMLHGKVLFTSKPNFEQHDGLLAWLRRTSVPGQCTACRFVAEFQGAIECAYCHEVIFPGDPVSTYSPMADELPEGFEARATRTCNGFVGCMGWECCPTGGFFSGEWTAEGIRTGFATGTAAGDAFKGGGIVSATIVRP
ncbi:hypothetical protein HY630_03620 [Candidatus Uhrbacteria bacterium]|nr:hypothetical protein [Candidatus Uhrbacteria bacterium]